MSGIHQSTRTHTILNLISILALIIIVGMLSGCSSSPLTATSMPTPTSTPLPAVSEGDVAEARSRLVATGITTSELTEACGYYANNDWSYTNTWNAANGVASQRIADVVTDISAVVEDIATPTEWVVSVAESIGKPLAEWTEADNDFYDSTIINRKRELLEPLCTQ